MSAKDWAKFWILGIIWGTSFLWIKIAVTEVSPLVLVGFRTLFGALGLLALVGLMGQMRSSGVAVKPYLGLFVVAGLFNVAVPFVFISWAEQHISSGLASILNSTTPLFAFVIGALLLRDEAVRFSRVAGLLVGFGGVVLLFLPELTGKAMGSGLLGQAAMLVAAISYAGAAVYLRRKAQAVPAQILAFYQLSAATLMMWGLTLVVERPVALPTLSITWVALLWLGLLGSSLSYILYFALLKTIGSTRATMVTYIPPLIGVLLGAVFLQERFDWPALAGGALILSGIVVVNRK